MWGTNLIYTQDSKCNATLHSFCIAALRAAAYIEHTYVCMSSAQYFCPILTNFGVSWQISLEVPNIKFHENPSGGSQANALGWWTCMMKLICAFHMYVYLIQGHFYISVHGYAIIRHVTNLNVLYWQLPRCQHESTVSYSLVDSGYNGRMWSNPCIQHFLICFVGFSQSMCVP